tara:strand:- start:456 stop:935 length:480 start_codon:yes stop_codon:yes gene_type:complete
MIIISSILFSQEKVLHISKTYPNGIPKEVTVYEFENDDLKSDNPFRIVEKIKYDSKGKYIQPTVKLSKEAKLAQRWIIGRWASEEMDSANVFLENNRDKSYNVIENGERKRKGQIYISEEDGIILLNYNLDGSGWNNKKIEFIDRNKFEYDNEIFFRKK